jgi:hypothetical protein
MATKTQRNQEPFFGVSVYSEFFEGTMRASHYLYPTLLLNHDCTDIILITIEGFPLLERSTTGPAHAISNCVIGSDDAGGDDDS